MDELWQVFVASPGFAKSKVGISMLRQRYAVTIGFDFNECHDPKSVCAIVLGDQSCDSHAMALFPHLRTIARTGTGYDNVDVNAAQNRGIIVTRVSSVNAEAVSEYSVGLLLALCRNIVTSHHTLFQDHEWQRVPGTMLSRMTVGIVGLGAIGRSLAVKLHGLGVGKLLGWNRTLRPLVLALIHEQPNITIVSLQEIMQKSDAVVICLASTSETQGFINKELLLLMKPTAFFVNIARGNVVDEDFLADILEEKKIAGAALDVYSIEPPQNEQFFAKLARNKTSNIILTPHVASFATSAIEEMSELVAQNVISVLEGHYENVEVVNNL